MNTNHDTTESYRPAPSPIRVRRTTALLACVATALASAGGAHAQVTLEYLSPASGDWSVAAYGCSGSGLTTAVTVFAPTVKAARWGDSGSSTLPAPIPTHSAYGWGVSGDGGTVLGWSEFSGSGAPVRRALLWRSSSSVPQVLGNLPGMSAGKAVAASFDGGVVVGASEPYAFSNSFHGFRWTPKGGMVALPGPGGQPSMIPTDISDGGTVICGSAANIACRVTGTPDALSAQSLGVLSGTISSLASAVSGDGATIVGTSSSSFEERPFKWTSDGGMVALPLPSGAGRALDVSNGGDTIVGDHSIPGGPFAVAWTTGLGFVNLNAYLDAAGVSRGGDTLETATGVSRDGRVIVGFTKNGQAFRIRNFNAPPSIPGDANGDGTVDATDLGMLLASWGTSGTSDINGDGVIDGADLAILLANWS